MNRRRSKDKTGAATKRLMKTMKQMSVRAGSQVVKQVAKSASAKAKPPPGVGDWISGRAIGAGGSRRYFLFRPHGVSAVERLPLLVMLHGCSQGASNFASSTRMNHLVVFGHRIVGDGVDPR